jgi:transposase
MKPYSKDLRLRVLAAGDAGRPRVKVAKTFSVSMPTIKRWLKRRRETADVQPKPIPGRPSMKGAMLQSWLPKHLQANDDLHRYLSVRCEEQRRRPGRAARRAAS